ncbi:MAG: GTP-binding protein [Lachnospiraceae bacterium]|nr:GTP-binding protein [Lachnospiraceae bacterium]
MMKADLITGFLGSGKTTFLSRYGEDLIRKEQHIGIIENDYGAVNVDMLLLEETFGGRAETEMIVAEDEECHMRRFKAKLITFGVQRLDRVVVEPSGIYDVDEFFDLLRDDPLERWYEPGSVIAIVDAALEEELSEESEYLLAAQTACAGKIVLSRVQEVSGAQIESTIAHLQRALQKAGCSRILDREKDFLIKDWADFTEGDFEMLREAGSVQADYVKRHVLSTGNYSSKYYLSLPFAKDELFARIEKLMQDPECGEIHRIKGFCRDGELWTEFNMNRHGLRTKTCHVGQEVLIVIGENINQEAVDACLQA